jgi:hypothetical protein
VRAGGGVVVVAATIQRFTVPFLIPGFSRGLRAATTGGGGRRPASVRGRSERKKKFLAYRWRKGGSARDLGFRVSAIFFFPKEVVCLNITYFVYLLQRFEYLLLCPDIDILDKRISVKQ